MMAGRGLAHTGGTLDKLESIPGFTVQQTEASFQSIVERVGCSIVSTTQSMVLADRKLYALRDVTGTVEGIPLQTSSILSKKIAENPDSLVLDVKYGRGSFQKNMQGAQELAVSLIHTAEMNGIYPTTALLTRMDIPIGRGIGNWLEVKECLDMMKGGETKSISNLKQLVLCEAAQMVRQSGVRGDTPFEDIVKELSDLLDSGLVLAKFRDMVEAQGGDINVVDNPDMYPSAPFQCSIFAPQDGFVFDMDALLIGHACVSLGAGRSNCQR
jgi:pyrimidine-nucleoside phosphorylase